MCARWLAAAAAAARMCAVCLWSPAAASSTFKWADTLSNAGRRPGEHRSSGKGKGLEPVVVVCWHSLCMMIVFGGGMHVFVGVVPSTKG
jgi:hypothetical protein